MNHALSGIVLTVTACGGLTSSSSTVASAPEDAATPNKACIKSRLVIFGIEPVWPGDIEPFRAMQTSAQEFTADLRTIAHDDQCAIVPPGSERDLADEKLIGSCGDENQTCMTKLARKYDADRLLYGRMTLNASSLDVVMFRLDPNTGSKKTWSGILNNTTRDGLAAAAYTALK